MNVSALESWIVDLMFQTGGKNKKIKLSNFSILLTVLSGAIILCSVVVFIQALVRYSAGSMYL